MPEPSNPPVFRLPTTVRPESYEIHLTAIPGQDDFGGEAAIDVRLAKSTDRIVLHAKGLEIESARVERDGPIVEAKTSLDADDETLTLALARRLEPGVARLRIRYSGKVGQSMVGLYHSKDGDEECLATQCEATDARRIFPCFDEPAFKAPIAWRITTKPGLTVLANGPPSEKIENNDGTVTWVFEPTPPISSYLAACAIGTFSATDAAEARGVPFRVWALGGKDRLGTHARDFAARLLPWYEDYFGQKYAFGKYDQLAVPSFSFGAMENVGLVVFRASLLLTDPKTTSWQGRKAIDLVVAHEFAHMWFGNLVTMAWWDDLWLNEAFAEWVAHRAVDELEPGHEVWHDFQDRTFSALDTDALQSTHPVYNPVETPEEAREMFDAITYGKGSAVLRMLEAYLGPDGFRKGLRSYMREFGRKNARGADLWNHLEHASDEPVAQIMQDWIGQPGHPVVRVRARPRDGTVALTFDQARARSSPKRRRGDETWRVPLVVRYADEKDVHETRHLLDAETGSLEVPVAGRLRWLVANAGDIGFYRVEYDDALRRLLVENATDLEPTERTAFLRDAWGLVKQGRLDVKAFLEAFVALANGADHHTVVDYAVSSARGIERMLEHAGEETALARFRAWVADRFVGPLRELGLDAPDEEPPTERQRRAALLRAVAAIGRHEEFTGPVLALAERERAQAASVDPNLAGLAVGVAAQRGDAARFELHRETYAARRAAHAAPHETDRYLYSFGAFRSPELVDRTLGLVADGTFPNQAVGPMLRIMLAEPHAQRAAWAFLKEKWTEVESRVGDAWVAILVEAAGALPPELRADVEATFDSRLDGTASQSRRRALERLADRQELYDRVLGDLVAWAKALAPAPKRLAGRSVENPQTR